MTEKTNILNLSFRGFQDYFESLGEPRYRAFQLVQWVHQRGIIDFQTMTNLSKSLRNKLSAEAEIRMPEINLERVSGDGTIKWLLELHDGNKIETVFIPDRTRGTLCVSSQVGCALNCSFCATGKEGFSRNLTIAEIIGQVWIAARRLKPPHVITNVVMMGMGEPLLNYDAVVPAMELMMSDYAYNLSKYRITLSTAGFIPGMEKLRKDSEVSLAVSLHATNDELRNELVPLNKKYPLRELIQCCRTYFTRGKRRIVFEYVMLDGINDRPEHAEALIHLLADIPCKINLIPFNPFSKTLYRRSSDAAIEQFQNRLIAAGFTTHVRRTRGEDIEGACGQLAGEIRDATGRHQRWLKTGRLVPA